MDGPGADAQTGGAARPKGAEPREVAAALDPEPKARVGGKGRVLARPSDRSEIGCLFATMLPFAVLAVSGWAAVARADRDGLAVPTIATVAAVTCGLLALRAARSRDVPRVEVRVTPAWPAAGEPVEIRWTQLDREARLGSLEIDLEERVQGTRRHPRQRRAERVVTRQCVTRVDGRAVVEGSVTIVVPHRSDSSLERWQQSCWELGVRARAQDGTTARRRYDLGEFRRAGAAATAPALWPFDQPPTSSTLTSVPVLERRLPILLAMHFGDDGRWGFTCGTTHAQGDVRMIGLGEALALDPTIASIADLPPGWIAQRSEVGAEWRLTPAPRG